MSFELQNIGDILRRTGLRKLHHFQDPDVDFRRARAYTKKTEGNGGYPHQGYSPGYPPGGPQRGAGPHALYDPPAQPQAVAASPYDGMPRGPQLRSEVNNFE